MDEEKEGRVKDINKVLIIGRLTRDAELKYTESGYAILNFSIATNRSVKKDEVWKDEVSYFDATLFGKRAEALAQYLEKGKQVVIDGSLKQDRWTQDGHSRSKVNITVDNIQFTAKQSPAAPTQVAERRDEIPF